MNQIPKEFMHAIFTGTIANGIGITRVVEDEKVQETVLSHSAPGLLVEAVPIQDPAKKDRAFQLFLGGQNFVILGGSLSAGIEVYGPFADAMDAEEFGEANRAEDAEWELTVVASQ